MNREEKQAKRARVIEFLNDPANRLVNYENVALACGVGHSTASEIGRELFGKKGRWGSRGFYKSHIEEEPIPDSVAADRLSTFYEAKARQRRMTNEQTAQQKGVRL